MTRLLLVLALPVLFLAACGDGDSPPDGSPGLATPTSTDGGGGEGETLAPGGEDKTEGPEETSSDNQTPIATAPGEVPTPPPPAAEGTPAVAPADESAFLGQFAGLDVQIEACSYNPATALTSCPGYGLYAIDPPMVGQDVQCSIWLVDGVPRALQCRAADPPEPRNYEIQS